MITEQIAQAATLAIFAALAVVSVVAWRAIKRAEEAERRAVIASSRLERVQHALDDAQRRGDRDAADLMEARWVIAKAGVNAEKLRLERGASR